MKARGFTLIETLIAVALIGFVALGAFSLISFMTNKSNQIAQEVDEGLFLTSLANYVQSQEGCETTLVNRVIPFGANILNNFSIPAGYSGVSGALGNGAISPGHRINSRTVLSEISLTRSATETAVNSRVPGTTPSIYLRTLVLNLQTQRSENTGGSNTRNELENKSINLSVYTNSANMVIGCSPTTLTNAQICDTMDGSIAAPGCKLGNECRVYGSFISKICSQGTSCKNLTTDNNAYTNPFTKTNACPANTSPIQTGKSASTYSHDESCGKKCSVAVTTTEYYLTCLRCE